MNVFKKLILGLVVLFFNSCNSESGCLEAYEIIKKYNCNIIVTKNFHKSSHWHYQGLKIKGKNIESQELTFFKTESRSWNSLSDYINEGDTLIKNEGEAIMYVYKKDSIVEMNLIGRCKDDFDWSNAIRISLRNNE